MGHNNWALTKEQTLKALYEFKKQGIAVLSRDIFEIINGIPEYDV